MQEIIELLTKNTGGPIARAFNTFWEAAVGAICVLVVKNGGALPTKADLYVAIAGAILAAIPAYAKNMNTPGNNLPKIG